MTENKITLTPFLTVNNCKEALTFYLSAFAAKVVSQHEIAVGKITAKVAIEGAEFYVGDEEPQHGNVSPDIHAGSSVRIILTTRKADEIFENAVKSGATKICPMTTEDDWRIGKLKDPFGHIWEIGYVL